MKDTYTQRYKKYLKSKHFKSLSPRTQQMLRDSVEKFEANKIDKAHREQSQTEIKESIIRFAEAIAYRNEVHSGRRNQVDNILTEQQNHQLYLEREIY